MTRRAAPLGVAALLVAVLAACGRYGPPRRVPVVAGGAPIAQAGVEDAAEDPDSKDQDSEDQGSEDQGSEDQGSQ